MLVISRNTAFTYRNKPVDTKQIGRELGVRYVLEGSARRSGKEVRVAAQLIDAEADAHIWAERFYGDTGDLFALQDEITSLIAVALDLELIGVEAGRPAAHPDAVDYILRGRAANLKPPSRDSRTEAISMFERSLALDPQSVEAHSLLATALMARVLDNLSDSRGRKNLAGKPWRHRPATRLRITPKARCCAPRTDMRRQFPNTRRRSRSIAIG
jgi:adenylate cyclase